MAENLTEIRPPIGPFEVAQHNLLRDPEELYNLEQSINPDSQTSATSRLGRFAKASVKDFFFGFPAALGGFLGSAPPWVMAKFIKGITPPKSDSLGINDIARELASNLEKEPSRGATSYMWDVADSTFQEVLDSGADFLASDFAKEHPVAASMIIGGTYLGPQVVGPQAVSSIVGLGLKGVVAAEVLRRTGLVKGLKDIPKVVRRMYRIGKMSEAATMVDADEAVKLAMQVHMNTVDEVWQAAKLHATDEIRLGQDLTRTFPNLPHSFRSLKPTSLPRELVESAKVEINMRTLLHEAGPKIRKEVESVIQRESLGELRWQKRFFELGGDIYHPNYQEGIREAAKETIKRARSPLSPPPRTSPDLFRWLKSFPKYGDALGRRFVYERDSERIATAQWNLLTKTLLDGKAGKALREDMTALAQKTGNFKVSPEDTLEAVTARIDAHPQGKLARQVVEESQKYLAEVYDEITELQGILGEDKLKHVPNYLSQFWDINPKKMQRSDLDKLLLVQTEGRPRVLLTKQAFEKERQIASYFEGMRSGLTPRTLDYVDILTIAREQHAKARGLKKVFRDMAEAPIITNKAGQARAPFLRKEAVYNAMSDSVKKEYTAISSPFFNRFVPGNDGTIFIHNDVYQPLANILTETGPLTGLDTVAALNKRSIFGFSVFHAVALAESSMSALGPVRGLKASARLGFGWPGLAHGLGGDRGLQALLRNVSHIEAQDRALFYGVTRGTPQTDVLRSVWDRSLEKWSNKLSQRAATKPGAKALDAIRWGQKQFDFSLWEQLHDPIKVYSFNVLYDDLLMTKKKILRGGKPTSGFWKILPSRRLAKMSDDEIGTAVAKFVNDEFGGQNWELMTGKLISRFTNPKSMRTLRTMFTSPDWNVSAINAGLSFAHVAGGNAATGMLGLRHWRNTGLAYLMYANTVNWTLAKAATGEGKFIWENESGRDKFHIDLQIRDEKGRKLYESVGKQFKDTWRPFGFFMNEGEVPFVSYLGSKLLPVWQHLSPVSPVNPRWDSFVEQVYKSAEEEARTLDGIEAAAAYAAQVADSLTPFAISSKVNLNFEEGTNPLVAGFLKSPANPLPISRGVGISSRRREVGDLVRKQLAGKNVTPELMEIYQALQENGYSEQQIESMFENVNTSILKTLIPER